MNSGAIPGPSSPTAITASPSPPSMRTEARPPPCSTALPDEVGKDALDPAPVGAHRRPLPGHVDPRLPAAAVHDALDQGGQIDLLDADGLDSRHPGARSPSGRRSGREARDTSATSRPVSSAASGGRHAAWRCSSAASLTSAVSGVRSSWATSAVNRRSRAWASVSAVILVWRASAMWLNEAAHAPNSSLPAAGNRVSSRPSASDRAAALALATGWSMTPRQQGSGEPRQHDQHEPGGEPGRFAAGRDRPRPGSRRRSSRAACCAPAVARPRSGRAPQRSSGAS